MPGSGNPEIKFHQKEIELSRFKYENKIIKEGLHQILLLYKFLVKGNKELT